MYYDFKNVKTQDKQEVLDNSITQENKSHREIPEIRFSDYENLDRNFCGLKSEKEIKSLNDEQSLQCFKEFSKFAGYYVPKNIIDSIGEVDIDNDQKLETIVYYSCRGCNAPSRSIDIIKNNKIIFSAKGGQLNIKPIKNEAGFILNTSELVLSRWEGYTAVKFKMGDDGEFNPVEEYDIKNSSDEKLNSISSSSVDISANVMDGKKPTPSFNQESFIKLVKYSVESENVYNFYVIYPEFNNFKNKQKQNELNVNLEEMAENFVHEVFNDLSPDPINNCIPSCDVNKNYQTYHANERVASILFGYSTNVGGMHGTEYTSPYNYDFVLHRKIKLNDLFKNNTDYLKFLSKESYDYFIKYNDAFDKEWVKSGTKAVEENFNFFSFDQYGVTFYFPPYQIAAYAAGELNIFFSYEELKQIIKEEYIPSDNLGNTQ